MPKYLRIDLLEPMNGPAELTTPDEALQEFFHYLLNEFSNHGIEAALTIVEEQAK